MYIKKLKIIGVILAFIIAFPLHFLYDIFPCFLISIIAPVNESIWEHMKIIFGSIILSGIIQSIIIKKRKIKYNNFYFSNYISAILAIIIFLIIYLPIYYLIGEHIILTLLLMLSTFIIAEYISIKIIQKHDYKQNRNTIIYILLTYILFGLLTYFPPHLNIFFCPKNLKYGI